MNTVEEIQEALADLVVKMGDKGVVTPGADVTIKANGRNYVYITSKYNTRPFEGSDSKLIFGDTISDAVVEAGEYIDNLPSPEDRVAHEYLTKVATAVDYATEHSIADEYVAPLRGVTCAMTENLLTCDGVNQ